MNHIYKEVNSCSKCNLHQNRIEGVVYSYRGTPDAPIIFIGEAPGKEENNTGIPFVGRSGKLLNNILNKLNIKFYYITNIVKCRPIDAFGKDRKPLHHEIEACQNYLLKELMFFSNKKIIFLGYTAANWGIPNEDIVMGQAYGNKLPLYHPSYLLRNRILIANWMEQLERFVND